MCTKEYVSNGIVAIAYDGDKVKNVETFRLEPSMPYAALSCELADNSNDYDNS